ncbi:MAG: hypothetical protein RLY66_638 [Candidatus Parcubacteria bacterium]|jgi:hypothetical protein
MIKITLDTNLLIELFDLKIEPRSIPDIGLILRHAFDQQTIDLKITTTVAEDLTGDKDKARAAALSLRVDSTFSVLGAGYVTSNLLPEDEIERKNFLELKKVLFPNLLDSDKRYRNKVNDVHHLHRHIRARRDVFVTNDSDILKKNADLKTAFATIVMSPSECAEYLTALETSSQYPRKKHVGRADYFSPKLSDEVRFDFTNNDKKFTIGTGDLIFETSWSECGADKMYAYNDAGSIEALAVAEGVSKFKEVREFQFYDSTSRVRKVTKDKDVLILKNSKGFFAAIKITDIQSRSREGDRNELAFQYVIQPNGTSIFKGLLT